MLSTADPSEVVPEAVHALLIWSATGSSATAGLTSDAWRWRRLDRPQTAPLALLTQPCFLGGAYPLLGCTGLLCALLQHTLEAGATSDESDAELSLSGIVCVLRQQTQLSKEAQRPCLLASGCMSDSTHDTSGEFGCTSGSTYDTTGVKLVPVSVNILLTALRHASCNASTLCGGWDSGSF